MNPHIKETFIWMKNCADSSVFISSIEKGIPRNLYTQKPELAGARIIESKRNDLKHSNIAHMHTTDNAERNKVPLSTSR